MIEQFKMLPLVDGKNNQLSHYVILLENVKNILKKNTVATHGHSTSPYKELICMFPR
jgi:hypothetical protein